MSGARTVQHTGAVDADGWPLAEVVTRLRRSLRSSVRSEIPWERLPMAQVELLQRLAESSGLRISELAARHRLATNTVSNLVQQMVEAGLVERGVDPGDRRAATVVITRLGVKHLRGWLEANSRRLGAALGGLSAQDQATIRAALPALTRLARQLESADSASSGRRDR